MDEHTPSRSSLEDALKAPVRAVLDRPSRALTSVVAERVADILIEEGVVERVVDKALQDPGVERAAIQVVDSDLLDELTERLMASDEMQQQIARIARSPEVRQAVAYQGFSMIDELRQELGRLAHRIDRRLGFKGAGIVTRVLALVADVAFINLGAVALSGLIAAFYWAIGADAPEHDEVLIVGAGAWVIALSVYLTFFLALTGQTPGMRFMGIPSRKQRDSSTADYS